MKIDKVNAKKKSILYVEDEEFQAKIFSRIIENELINLGYKVVIFNKGGDFISLINSRDSHYKIEEFGVILLDMEMHDFSGFDMLKEARANEIKIPIAILSAIEDQFLRDGAIQFGAKDYFIKGKDLQELDRLKLFIVDSMKN